MLLFRLFLSRPVACFVEKTVAIAFSRHCIAKMLLFSDGSGRLSAFWEKIVVPYFKVSSPVGKTPWKASPMIIPNLIANAVLHQFNSDSLFHELVQFSKKDHKDKEGSGNVGRYKLNYNLKFSYEIKQIAIVSNG